MKYCSFLSVLLLVNISCGILRNKNTNQKKYEKNEITKQKPAPQRQQKKDNSDDTLPTEKSKLLKPDPSEENNLNPNPNTKGNNISKNNMPPSDEDKDNPPNRITPESIELFNRLLYYTNAYQPKKNRKFRPFEFLNPIDTPEQDIKDIMPDYDKSTLFSSPKNLCDSFYLDSSLKKNMHVEGYLENTFGLNELEIFVLKTKLINNRYTAEIVKSKMYKKQLNKKENLLKNFKEHRNDYKNEDYYKKQDKERIEINNRYFDALKLIQKIKKDTLSYRLETIANAVNFMTFVSCKRMKINNVPDCYKPKKNIIIRFPEIGSYNHKKDTINIIKLRKAIAYILEKLLKLKIICNSQKDNFFVDIVITADGYSDPSRIDFVDEQNDIKKQKNLSEKRAIFFSRQILEEMRDILKMNDIAHEIKNISTGYGKERFPKSFPEELNKGKWLQRLNHEGFPDKRRRVTELRISIRISQ